MAWRAVHPALTDDRQIPADDATAPTFTLGFWPPLEAEKAKIYVASVRSRKEPDEQLVGELDVSRRAAHDLRAFWSMVRFGVRGWRGLGDVTPALETVEIDGRKHQALTSEACETLYHAGLLLPVALECWKFNNLTEEEKKTSSSESISTSSTNRTPVRDVTRPSDPAKNGAAFSASTTSPSTAALTS